MSYINSEVKAFKATAFHNGDFSTQLTSPLFAQQSLAT